MITMEQYRKCLSLGFPPLPAVEQYFSNIESRTIVDDTTVKLLRQAYKSKDWAKYNSIASNYYPSALDRYINKRYFIIDINNKKVKIPIYYSKACDNNTPFATCSTCLDNNDRIVWIRIYLFSTLLICGDRMIDCIIAHELAHAKRRLEDKASDNVIHEEFWADREIKKMLPVVNDKYKDRQERKMSLQFIHSQISRTRYAGIFSPLGEFWDRLFPFSDTIQKYPIKY